METSQIIKRENLRMSKITENKSILLIFKNSNSVNKFKIKLKLKINPRY